MGVYIREMKMPRGCGTCGFHYFKKDECSWYSCSLLSCDKDEGSNGADIQNNCPLKEIPTPHGRLIDEDVLKKRSKYVLAHQDGYTLDDCIEFTKTPTVIEAEGE